MEAKKLYQILDKEFDLTHCKDDWSEIDFNDFIVIILEKDLWDWC